MTNPFGMMASVLATGRPATFPRPVVDLVSINRCNGKTAALRLALEQGAFTALELARITSLGNSGLVYALLKADIKKGRVELVDGIYRRGQS